MGINQSFFTDKTYARGDQAYVHAESAVNTANQAAQDAADAIAAVNAMGDGNGLVTFLSPSEPIAEGHGDLWFDTDDGNKLYRWNGAYGVVPRTNYMPQPSAEYSSTNWSAIRGSFDVDPTVLIDTRSTWRSVVSDVGQVGNLNQRMEWNGSITATTGQAWSVTCMMRSSVLSAITKYKSRIVWLDSGNNLVAYTESVEFTATASDAWVKLTVSGTAPDTTTHFSLQAGPSDGTQIQVSDAYWLGDVLVEQTSNPGVYFDGGMDDADWSGTPGASTSTFTPGWVVVQDQSIGQAILDAAGAQATADGKIRTFAQPGAPSMTNGQDIGDLWIDTDANNKLYRWDGDSWEPVYDARVDSHDSAIVTLQTDYTTLSGRVDGKSVVWVQPDAPTGLGSADQGDIWIDTDNNRKAQVWTGSAWQDITDQNALDALSGLTSKITTFWADNAPTATATGDLWVDTNDNNRLYRWSGSQWVDISDARITTIEGQIVTIQSDVAGLDGRVDGKSTVWVQTTDPSSGANPAWGVEHRGDIWINTSTTDRVSKVWDGDSWENITDQATLDLLDTVNAKITTWYSSTAPAGAVDGDLWIDSDDGRLYRLALTTPHGPTSYTNLVLNPSLEVNDVGWTGAAIFKTSSTEWAYTGLGTGSIKTYPTGTETDNWVGFGGDSGALRNGMQAGHTYTASAYCHVPVALTGAHHSDSRTLRIVGFYHQTSGYSEVSSSTGPVSGGTARLAVTMAIPADADEAFFRLYNGYTNSASNVVFWDGYMIVEGYNNLDYIDGTLAQCSWNGTAHNSTSTYTPISTWTDISDTRISSQAGQISTLQSNLTTLDGKVDGKAVIWVQATAPTGLVAADQGDFWIDTSTTDRVTKVWDGDSWENVSDAAALSALSQVTSKITTFWNDNPPTATAIGDLWVDTNDSNKLYRASAVGSANWVLVADTRIEQAASDAAAALTAANGKNEVTYSTSSPTTEANVAGDIWYRYFLDGSTAIINGQWIGQGGTSWTQVTLNNLLIANLDAGKITTGFMDVSHLAGGSITADKLSSLLILVGKIASAQTGRRWEADQMGIRLYETDGSLLIHLPTDANTPATFKGDIIARSFISDNQFAVRGGTNEISAGAVLTLAGGITAPTNPPQINVDWDTLARVPAYTGHWYDPYQHGLAFDGTWYYIAQTDENGDGHVRRYDPTTGAVDGSWVLNTTIGDFCDGGLTTLGNYVYVVTRHQGDDTWYVEEHTKNDGNYVGYFTLNNSDRDIGYWGVLGTNGTDLLYAYFTSSGAVKIQQLAPTIGTLIATWTTNWTHSPKISFTSVSYGTFDYGATRLVITYENRENAVYSPMAVVLATSGSNYWTVQNNELFPVSGQTRGMCWNSNLSKFVRLRNENVFVLHSGIKWTTETDSWWASQTWYDSVATTHETDQSPRTRFTMIKRAVIRWNGGTIPTGGTDDPNQMGVYLGRGTSDPGRAQMERQGYSSTAVTGLSAVTLPSVGSNATNPPPTTNGFTTGAPAQLRAQDSSKLLLKGDGTGNWGSITVGTKTTIGTHVLRTSAIDTASLPGDASWTSIDWTGTTSVNDDSWTLSADGIYWTCPVAGTYSVLARINIEVLRAWRIEMDVESAADGMIRVNGFANNHDYICATVPAARMSVNDRIKVSVALNASQATVNVLDTSLLLVTRLG